VNSYPARRYYERVADASGYPLASLERVFRLTALLVDIVARVPDELLLRGGTLDATPLGDRVFVQRVHANPGLLWRLRRGLEGLEER